MAVIAFALPVVVFLVFYKNNQISLAQFVAFSILSEFVFVFLFYAWKNRNVRTMLLGVVVVMMLAEIFLIPKTPGLLNRNPDFRSLRELRTMPEVNSLPYYSIGEHEFRIELVYEAGKEVKPWDSKAKPEFPERNPFVVFSTEKPEELFSASQLEKMELQTIGFFDYNRNRIGQKQARDHFRKYVSIVKVKPAN